MPHKAPEAVARLGATSEERFDYLLALAKELYDAEGENAWAWRRVLCKEAAKRIDHEEDWKKIYGFINALSQENISELRAAMIGKEASDVLCANRKYRRRPGRESGAALDEATHNNFDAIIETLSPERRTIDGVAEASGKPAFMVLSYAYQNPAFRRKLSNVKDILKFKSKVP